MQHITITKCCQKDISLNHTDTRLYKKRDWHNTAPHMFYKTRFMYAVSSEACLLRPSLSTLSLRLYLYTPPLLSAPTLHFSLSTPSLLFVSPSLHCLSLSPSLLCLSVSPSLICLSVPPSLLRLSLSTLSFPLHCTKLGAYRNGAV